MTSSTPAQDGQAEQDGSAVVVIAAMTAVSGQAANLKDAMHALIAPTRAEAGCEQYELHADTDNPDRFVFVERWTSMAALEAHRQSPHLLAFREQAPSLLANPAHVQILTSLA